MTSRAFVKRWSIALCVVMTATISVTRPLAADETASSGLVDMSIEQLINLSVTSPGKKEQKVSDAASAVFVITSDDIRRSGVTSIPEALRMAPGLEVARINSHSWAVTSRGFNNLFANKLLVLIDGRSVYTPLFSGVFWDQVDVMLEDVDRIEVIRGPGATLWGSNAVNGVVNIITKGAAETQGALIAAGVGSEERALASVRHGGRSERAAYRIYAKAAERDETVLKGDTPSVDDWRAGQFGFRIDGESGPGDAWTLQGDGQYQEKGADFLVPSMTVNDREHVTDQLYSNSANVLGRWVRDSGDDETRLQLYFERIERDDSVNEHSRYTGDLELQHRFSPLERHEIVTGGSYRHYEDDIDDTSTLSADPESRSVDLFTFFVQDDISIADDRAHIVLGSKLEHTDFTGFEVQPNARAIAQLADGHSVWAAISRAVRTPSRFSNDGTINLESTRLPDGDAALVSVRGDRSYESENLIAYEAGYRAAVGERTSFDIALFWNDYDELQTIEPFDDLRRVPFRFDNKADATARGGELAVDWKPLDSWRLIVTYSRLQLDIEPDESSRDRLAQDAEGKSPKNQVSLRSLVDLPYGLELDSSFRYVDTLESSNVSSYYNLDARLGWHASDSLELSLVGQNLLDRDHLEFVPGDFVVLPAHELQRGVYGKLTWRF